MLKSTYDAVRLKMAEVQPEVEGAVAPVLEVLHPGPGFLKYSDVHTSTHPKGSKYSPREKAKQLQIRKYIQDLWEAESVWCEELSTYVRVYPSDFNVEFEKITHYSKANLYAYKAELARHPVGFLGPAKKPGKPGKRLEEEYPQLEEWLRSKIEAAKAGGYITIGGLIQDLYDEIGGQCTRRRMSRTLKRLGYVYQSRCGNYITRRQAEVVQSWCKDHCKWIFENSEEVSVEGGGTTFVMTVPTAWSDEAYEYSKAFQYTSWTKKGDKEVDRGKGKGTRINLIDAVFSGVGPHAVDVARVDWSSGQTKPKVAGEPYCGKYGTAEIMTHYYLTKVFPTLGQGGYLCIDNASTHKKFTKRLSDFTFEELLDYLHESPNVNQVEFAADWAAAPVNSLVVKNVYI